MQTCVTGATGFVGSATVSEFLGAGQRVIGLARTAISAGRVPAWFVPHRRPQDAVADRPPCGPKLSFTKSARAATGKMIKTRHTPDLSCNVVRSAAPTWPSPSRPRWTIETSGRSCRRRRNGG
ncbi:NAD-dependent epimerase/dehydratase family protein [Paracoccus liaowanqingii]|uniref:NAD-dependent epimerase/dehydratase family protein n=1 Tax=Paracoccus liaowanqingii TaxID=2560053 RepID=A0A4P7HRZ7_9RHOB|nr:NAD-dependent epimerase/dehydratase family protein [Paracoccus liaowanqingii]